MKRTALLLKGSQRRSASTSAVLGEQLLKYLRTEGFRCSRSELRNAVRTVRGIAETCQAIDAAELVILSFPLYLDTVPYCVTRLFETVYSDCLLRPTTRPGLVAVANCGFPEARHNDLALAVCRQMALSCGMRWLGGLSLGGGEALKGRPLEWFLPLTYPTLQALRWTAAALAAGSPVPERARRRMARPLMPRRLYYLIADLRWYRTAFRAGVGRRMGERHYR